MLVIDSIHVEYELAGVAEDARPIVDRVLGFHAEHCPVARSIEHSIGISTSVTYV